MEETAIALDLDEREKIILERIGSCADTLGLESYLIGGYVRDKILGRPTQDMDIVTVGDGIALATLVSKKLGVAPPTIFKRFGTAMIKVADFEIEFVGARKESYTTDSRKPHVEAGTLRDDQLRRDLTINALAFGINRDNWGEILDPFEGLQDLHNQCIRTPLDPDKTFSDDPLRMLRAIRFATQLGYDIAPKTFEGIRRNKDRIKIVSQERIITELNKIILAPKPSIGFKLLLDSELVEIIFPEMYALHGVEVINGRAHKDNYYHTIQVLDNVAQESPSLWLRWAAIMHDIGKPKTKRFNPKIGWTFHGHDAVGAGMTPRIFRRMKLPMDQKMHFVKKLVRLHLRPISLTKDSITDSAIRRLLYEAGDDIDDLMILCQADITTKNPKKMQRYLENYEIVKQKMQDIEEKDQLRNWQPPISGEIIMETFGISPCRTVGDIKNAIREGILDGDIENNYQAAYDFMIEKGKSLGLTPATSQK